MAFPNHILIIDEKDFDGETNENYEAAELHLRTKLSPASTWRLHVSKTPRRYNNTTILSLAKGADFADTFDGIELKWSYIVRPAEHSSENNNDHSFNRLNYRGNIEKLRYFELKFPKEHGDKVMNSYLPYLLEKADSIRHEQKVPKLYTRGSDSSYYGIFGHPGRNPSVDQFWSSVDLQSSAKFDTMAIEPELKKTIVDDLDTFVKRKEVYKKMGKPWMRGYLLYGPPRTGKSTLIAAMAHHLKFDVFELGLTNIYKNSELRKVLMDTTNRSILVLKDRDCSGDDQNKQNRQDRDRIPPFYHGYGEKPKKYTLSGLLDLVQGLWTSVGDERIIVFVTNKHKNELDPALLRAGRMDLHIPMSYCTPAGFKVLASKYLGIDEDKPHRLFGEIQGLLESTEVAPADVAEELMKSDDADVALEGLLDSIKRKRSEDQERKKFGGARKQRRWDPDLDAYYIFDGCDPELAAAGAVDGFGARGGAGYEASAMGAYGARVPPAF